MSKRNKKKPKGKWIDGPNGTSHWEDRRSDAERTADMLRSVRAGRRAAEIEAGHNASAGCGVHGETSRKNQKHRKDRRETKARLRHGNNDE